MDRAMTTLREFAVVSGLALPGWAQVRELPTQDPPSAPPNLERRVTTRAATPRVSWEPPPARAAAEPGHSRVLRLTAFRTRTDEDIPKEENP